MKRFDRVPSSLPCCSVPVLPRGSQGHNDDARRFLVDALKLDPALTPASLLLGSVLYQTGDLDGAIDTYQRALALDPKNPQSLASS